MKRALGLPKTVHNNIRLQNEIKNWDQRLHSLHLAVKYKESNTEEDMESKIIQWRTYAQKAAMALLPYYQEQVKNISVYNGYDYEFDNRSMFVKNDVAGTNSSNESQEEEEAQNGKNTGGLDDMSTMLNAIGINPDMLHYSAELGDFY